MSSLPSLPPIYALHRLLPGDNALATALQAAPTAEPAELFWEERDDWLRFAVTLAPDQPLANCLAAGLALSVAVVEALGVLGPPEVAVTHRWPDRVMVNGALAGGVGLAVPEGVASDQVPDWLVGHLSIRFQPDPEAGEPGEQEDRTALFEEGMMDLTVPGLLESVSRHLLLTMHRWESDGLKPVVSDWYDRADGREEAVEFPLADGGSVTAKLLGLADDGSAILSPTGGGTLTLSLLDRLGKPSWEDVLGAGR